MARSFSLQIAVLAMSLSVIAIDTVPFRANIALTGALAQTTTVKKSKKITRKLRPSEIKARWSYETWKAGVMDRKLKNPDGTAKIPDTDCPPLSAQTCLDSWKNPNDDIANWPD